MVIFKSREDMRFKGFETWADVLAVVDSQPHGPVHTPLYYHAPLDLAPRMVAVVKRFKNGKLRIDPISPDAGNFTADEGHLDRFYTRLWP